MTDVDLCRSIVSRVTRGAVRLLAISVLVVPLVQAGDVRIVGYYPNWNRSVFPHTSVRYDILTHIAHAFIFPYADGTIDYSGFSTYPELISSAHAKGVKVVIAVGGWDATRTPRFSQLAADSASRARFVQDLVNFCVTNGYDGVDLDWEYPKTAADKANLTILVKQLRAAFNAQSPVLSLSAALPAGWWSGQWYDMESMHADFDWLGMMTYDFYGAWTPKAGPNSPIYAEPSNTEGWVANSVSYWKGTRGVPTAKLLIGVPFYGQQFNATALWGVSTAAVQVTYKNIAPKLDQGWTRSWNQVGCYPYLINGAQTQVITYDDVQSVDEKVNYVKATGCGGVIIWAIGQDEIAGGQPLLEALAEAFTPTSAEPKTGESLLPRSFELLQNYPNPFNAESQIKYRLRSDGIADLTVFDLLGRVVMNVASGLHAAGEHRAVVSSRSIDAGVYFYRLSTLDGQQTRRFVVIP